MTNQGSNYTWPVFSDDPLEEGFRTLARIILRKVMEQRASARAQAENGVVCHAD